MLRPRIPIEESQRLRALQELLILDTPAEERFDRITRLARRLFQVPVALISLVDHDRQWFKSRQGMAVRETARDISFCGHAILADGAFVVPDACEDERFRDNPLVTGDPHIRFYAGIPLKASDGSRVGTLCIVDHRPRRFSADEEQGLRDLSALVEEELQLSRLRDAAALLKVREEELRHKNALQRAILDSANVTIISTNPEGIIQTFNRAAELKLGYRKEEVVGKATPELIHDSEEVQRRAAALESELGREVERGFGTFTAKARLGLADENEWTYVRKDGSRFPVLLSVTALRDKEGGITGFMGVGLDITERKQIERMKNEFISLVSHELRTPLTSIRGALGLVSGGVLGEIPAEARAMIDIANEDTERLVRLINGILDVEKIEAGKMDFQLELLDLVALVKQAIETNRPFAMQSQVEFVFTSDVAEARVRADADRIIQVLTNLISNAIKFSPVHGYIHLSIVRRDHGFRVSVRDQGPGVPEDFRGRLFQKFAQADSSASRQGGGSGLGLSISKAIVEKHGGQIGFETSNGAGSTFHFDLPEAT